MNFNYIKNIAKYKIARNRDNVFKKNISLFNCIKCFIRYKRSFIDFKRKITTKKEKLEKQRYEK